MTQTARPLQARHRAALATSFHRTSASRATARQTTVREAAASSASFRATSKRREATWIRAGEWYAGDEEVEGADAVEILKARTTRVKSRSAAVDDFGHGLRARPGWFERAEVGASKTSATATIRPARRNAPRLRRDG
jgi:hypothetical protein